jgi:hypothetical protein
MKIDIVGLVGPLCITTEDGELIREQIVDQLQRPSGAAVEVDFAGVRVLASPFLNAAVGGLVRDRSADELNKRMRFLNLSGENAALVRRVIANAREYFANPAVKKIIDEASGKVTTSEPT